MTISAQEQQVRLQFLEEAQDYVDQIETGLLGVGNGDIKGKQFDAVLRAAHSIKGGAAMMRFSTLAKIGHRLEDSLKVLRHGQKPAAINGQLEKDLLLVVDRLRRVMDYNRQGQDIPPDWLATAVEPVLDRLYEQLGEPQAVDEAALLAEEDGQEEDIVVYLFESEVDSALQHLEDILSSPAQTDLHAEIAITTETLNGLAEMIELPAMAALCQDIAQKLAQSPDQFATIAELAVAAWRRSQSLVMIGHRDNLPTFIDFQTTAVSGTTLTPLSLPTVIASPATLLSLDSLFDDAETPATAPQWSDLDIFNVATDAESIIVTDHADELASLDDLTIFDDIATTPISLDFSEVDNELVADQLFTTTADCTDMLPALTEQPVLEWVNNAAPPSDDFFSLLSSFEVPTSPPNQSDDFFGAIDNLDIDDLEAAPHGYVTPETYHHTPAPDQTIRVGVNQLAMIGDLFGELNISRSGLNLQIMGMRSLLQSLTEKVSSLETASSQLRHTYDQIATQVPTANEHGDVSTIQNSPTNDFDLLEMDRYGEFHLLSQAVIETVVQIQEKVTDIDIQLNETEIVTRDISRTTKQMQNSFTSVRMLPFLEVVGRFPRAIREMSIEHGKQVDLTIKGSEILVERHVIEILKDPLMHLLRNCFDHGIEVTADRLAAGKPATGKIEISAAYRGNQTVITIRDDGKGIDLAKIRDKAIKMGIDEEMLQQTSERELLELIFEPGFSTAEKVTDLSGRGVGMDVVRTNLRAAKGEIQIETKAGQGSTFIITVPFTLSVIKALIVDVNKMLFALPVNAVEETLLPNFDQIVIREGQPYLDWEEFQVRLIDMAAYFKAPDFLPALDFNVIPKIDQSAVFLAADGDQLYGLQVDRFWSEQEVTVRQPQGVISLPPGLSGSAILGDGRVIPLVDPIALARWIIGHGDSDVETVNQADDFAETTLDREQLVMVVDDSINVRRFVALTLERNGYRVEQAKDGQEAIEKIQAGLLPNLVICDLEMPRMDGYGFLANVKSLENAKHIPVVMLTSRSGQKHRKIAMNLGAAAYYAKPFNEADMLNTISELII
jgi:two-component system, chemotaxis family, sensor histidine kinase and response regulator PixL